MSDLFERPVEVLRTESKKLARENVLVLQSLGIPHRLVQAGGGYSIVVLAASAAEAREQLARYAEENAGWTPRRFTAPPIRSRGWRAAIVYGVVIAATYPIGQYGLLGWNFWEHGVMSASKVREGEWWRTVTALTLHADWSHLFGNLVFGALFGVLTAHLLGSGLTWFCIVLAGALGNLANAYVQDPSHRAIGASTAAFGALGVMASYEWVRRHTLRLPPMRRFAPLLGGALLLGFLGMSSQRTDVMAHVTGLAAGGLLGAGVAWTRLPESAGPRAQALLGVLALALPALAWACARAFGSA